LSAFDGDQCRHCGSVISSIDPYLSQANPWLGNSAAKGHCAEALKDKKEATIVLILGAPHTLINGNPFLAFATGHLDPVQFLFDSMKGIVPDLVAGAHDEDRLPGRLQRGAMEFAARGARSRVAAGIPMLVCQTCRERLTEPFGDG